MTQQEAILGCLLGEALGDSVGLWCEGLTPNRQRRFANGPLQQRFLFGKGMEKAFAELASVGVAAYDGVDQTPSQVSLVAL